MNLFCSISNVVRRTKLVPTRRRHSNQYMYNVFNINYGSEFSVMFPLKVVREPQCASLLLPATT